jgi:putative membrane protein
MPGGGQQQQPQQPTGATTSPGMSPSPGMPGTANNEQAYSDAVFVQDAMQNSEAQVAMSQLAVTKSPSTDVQQFGQKMVQIHTALGNQLKPAAKQLGVDEPKGPSKKEKQEIAKLEGLSGPDFDTAYLTALAKEQQKNLRAFKDEETSAQSPGLQQAAKQDEPILTEHYQVLEKLAQAHNVTITEANK